MAALGVIVVIWPSAWADVFTQDVQVLAYAYAYLRTVGPVFGLFGMGLVLYFASLGAGHVLGPVLAGTVRLLVVMVGGAWLMWDGNASAQSLFMLVSVAMALYGVCTAWAVWRTPWSVHKR